MPFCGIKFIMNKLSRFLGENSNIAQAKIRYHFHFVNVIGLLMGNL